MAVHIAYVKPTSVDPAGNVLDRNASTTTIKQMMTASTRMIVMVNATYAPNADGTQTIEEYLTAEDAGGFNLIHMDQNTIITSDA